MKEALLLIILLHALTVNARAQTEIMAGGMRFSYTLYQNEIEISLSAPTEGWLGIGFNDKDDIVGSDLLLFHIVNDQLESLDMYVKSIGNPMEDTELGGTADILTMEGKEEKGRTRVTFRLPLNSKDQFDYQHQIHQPFWLILAYSTQDDFGHHSRMRKHFNIQLE